MCERSCQATGWSKPGLVRGGPRSAREKMKQLFVDDGGRNRRKLVSDGDGEKGGGGGEGGLGTNTGGGIG